MDVPLERVEAGRYLPLVKGIICDLCGKPSDEGTLFVEDNKVIVGCIDCDSSALDELVFTLEEQIAPTQTEKKTETKHERIVRLHDVEGMSLRAIAAHEHLSPSTVQGHLQREALATTRS